MSTVELRGLRRQFGSVVALDDLSINISSGEFVSLLGPSGCGKTTALRIVAGFEWPDTGEVLVDGWLAYACEVFPDLAEVDRG